MARADKAPATEKPKRLTMPERERSGQTREQAIEYVRNSGIAQVERVRKAGGDEDAIELAKEIVEDANAQSFRILVELDMGDHIIELSSETVNRAAIKAIEQTRDTITRFIDKDDAKQRVAAAVENGIDMVKKYLEDTKPETIKLRIDQFLNKFHMFEDSAKKRYALILRIQEQELTSRIAKFFKQEQAISDEEINRVTEQVKEADASLSDDEARSQAIDYIVNQMVHEVEKIFSDILMQQEAGNTIDEVGEELEYYFTKGSREHSNRAEIARQLNGHADISQKNEMIARARFAEVKGFEGEENVEIREALQRIIDRVSKEQPQKQGGVGGWLKKITGRKAEIVVNDSQYAGDIQIILDTIALDPALAEQHGLQNITAETIIQQVIEPIRAYKEKEVLTASERKAKAGWKSTLFTIGAGTGLGITAALTGGIAPMLGFSALGAYRLLTSERRRQIAEKEEMQIRANLGGNNREDEVAGSIMERLTNRTTALVADAKRREIKGMVDMVDIEDPDMLEARLNDVLESSRTLLAKEHSTFSSERIEQMVNAERALLLRDIANSKLQQAQDDSSVRGFFDGVRGNAAFQKFDGFLRGGRNIHERMQSTALYVGLGTLARFNPACRGILFAMGGQTLGNLGSQGIEKMFARYRNLGEIKVADFKTEAGELNMDPELISRTQAQLNDREWVKNNPDTAAELNEMLDRTTQELIEQGEVRLNNISELNDKAEADINSRLKRKTEARTINFAARAGGALLAYAYGEDVARGVGSGLSWLVEKSGIAKALRTVAEQHYGVDTSGGIYTRPELIPAPNADFQIPATEPPVSARLLDLATVRKGDGITQVLQRQILEDPERFGYEASDGDPKAWSAQYLREWAISNGIIKTSGGNIVAEQWIKQEAVGDVGYLLKTDGTVVEFDATESTPDHIVGNVGQVDSHEYWQTNQEALDYIDKPEVEAVPEPEVVPEVVPEAEVAVEPVAEVDTDVIGLDKAAIEQELIDLKTQAEHQGWSGRQTKQAIERVVREHSERFFDSDPEDVSGRDYNQKSREIFKTMKRTDSASHFGDKISNDGVVLSDADMAGSEQGIEIVTRGQGFEVMHVKPDSKLSSLNLTQKDIAEVVTHNLSNNQDTHLVAFKEGLPQATREAGLQMILLNDAIRAEFASNDAAMLPAVIGEKVRIGEIPSFDQIIDGSQPAQPLPDSANINDYVKYIRENNLTPVSRTGAAVAAR